MREVYSRSGECILYEVSTPPTSRSVTIFNSGDDLTRWMSKDSK